MNTSQHQTVIAALQFAREELVAGGLCFDHPSIQRIDEALANSADVGEQPAAQMSVKQKQKKDLAQQLADVVKQRDNLRARLFKALDIVPILKEGLYEVDHAYDIRPSILHDCLDAAAAYHHKAGSLSDMLRLILPMAKGYAACHPVGRNAEFVAQAEALVGDSADESEPITAAAVLTAAAPQSSSPTR